MHSFLVVKLISKICLLVLWHFSLYYEIFVHEIHICCDFFQVIIYIFDIKKYFMHSNLLTFFCDSFYYSV